MRIPGASVLLLAVVAASIGLSEHVVRPKERPGRIVVSYWEKWTGFEGEAMREVVDEFNRSQDRIWVDYLSISAVNTKTLMAAAAGIPPDLAGIWDTDVAPFADANAVLVLDELCSEAGIRQEDYIPVYWDICEYRGQIFALPTTPASTALHWNRRLFREAGLDPDVPPKTLEELFAMGEKITQRGSDGKLKVAGFFPAEPGWWNWGWGYVFGGKLWDGGGNVTANLPENIRAFEWVRSFSEKYGSSDLHTFRSGFGNFSSPQNAFMSEKVAMVLQGVWMANFIERNNPKLDWSAAPFPHPADRPDLANLTFAGLDVLVIPRGAKRPREAFEFVRFVQSQKGMELLCLGQKKHTPLMKVSDEFLRKHPNPHIRLFIDLAKGKNAVSAPQVGIWTEFNSEMTNAFDEVYLMKKTPKEALGHVQARMQPKLERYQQALRQREAAR